MLTRAEQAADEPGDVHLLIATTQARSVAAHVVPLVQYAALGAREVPSLLDAFAEARAGDVARTARRRGPNGGARRCSARIAKRTHATGRANWPPWRRASSTVVARDRLRQSGDAALHLRPRHSRRCDGLTFRRPIPSLTITLDPDLDTKQNAQRYLCALSQGGGTRLPHLERRREALAARRGALDVLAFEVERADSPTIPELEADLDALEGRPPQRSAAANTRRRPPLRLDRPSGARIYVGRSPREKRRGHLSDRTSRRSVVPRARGIPGSHVGTAKPRPAATPGDEDLDAAADLARDATAKRATRRGSKSTTPNGSTSASSGTVPPASSGTPCPHQSRPPG